MRTIEEIKADIEECSCFGTQSKLDALWLEWFRCLFYSIEPDRLSEICQAEREQRAVVLPCKVGDTVWINFTPKWPANPEHKGKWFTKEAEIERIKLGVKGLSLQTYIKSFTPDDFGKTVFLSYEAAQSALEGGAK